MPQRLDNAGAICNSVMGTLFFCEFNLLKRKSLSWGVKDILMGVGGIKKIRGGGGKRIKLNFI